MINITLISIGVIFLIYGLMVLIKFLLTIKDNTLSRWWILLLTLVCFFVIGYIFFVYWLRVDKTLESHAAVASIFSLIFFFGSVFVVVSVSLISITVSKFIKESTLNKQLTNNLEERIKEKTEQLNNILTQTKDQNKKLQDSRLAMLNLLEDEKQLEIELKKQKNSIENQVIERTKELETAKNEIAKGWLNIHQEKLRLTASIEALSDAYILVDDQKNIVLTNNRLETVLGTTLKNIDIKNIQKNLDQKFDLFAEIENCIQQNKRSLFEQTVGTRYFRITLAPIFDSGKVMGALLIISNITEEKANQRARDEFFSIASHELRTPLTAIRGNAALIQEHYLKKIKDKEFIEMVTDINDAATRLIAVVNDFLNMSRLEMGKITFKKDHFPIISTIELALEQYRKSLKTTNPNIAIPKILGKEIEVYADKDRVIEIITNLVGNAIKFTTTGKIWIKILTNKSTVKVFVNDTGRGIPLENQSLLFRKFQQAGPSLYTRDTTKGTGLGLYISKLLVEGMGGNIWLEKSQKDQGASFCFTLPLYQAKQVS